MQDTLRKPLSNLQSLFIPRTTISCFCDTEGTAQVLRNVAKDPLLSRSNMNVVMGSLKAAIETYPTGLTPNILIVEYTGNPEHLEQLANVCAVSTNVIIIGEKNDVTLYKKMIALGVVDYLYSPINQSLMLEAIARAANFGDNQTKGKVCGFFGAGGGTGTSTIAQNFAVALSQRPGARVVLIDLDFTFGSSTLNFDVKPQQEFRNLIMSGNTFSSEELENQAVLRSDTLSLLTSNPTLQGVSTPSAETIALVLEKARQIWDYIIVDLPSGWHDVHTEILSSAELAVVISLPTLNSYQSTRQIMNMSESVRASQSIPHLLLNRVNHKAEKQLPNKVFENEMSQDLLSVMPENEKLFASASELGKVAMEMGGSNDLAQNMSALINLLFSTRELKDLPRAKGIFSWLKRRV